MAKGKHITQAVRKTTWTIIFLNDFHAQMTGYGEDSKGGGIEKIAQLIRNRRFQAQGEINESNQNVIVCFGGDILRDNANRFVHSGTASAVWDSIMNKIKPEVVVLGNHDLRDFDIGFVDHIINYTLPDGSKCGCTRNIEWSDGNSVKGKKCKGLEVMVPPCSLHKCCKELCNYSNVIWFIGLTESGRRGGYVIGSYTIRDVEDTVVNILVPHCLKDNCICRNENAVFVHLAHYGGLLRPWPWPNVPYSDKRFEACGLKWASANNWTDRKGHMVSKDEWRPPHFVLKAHDHTLSPTRRGCVNLIKRYEMLSTNKRWVPSFEAGQDGEALGILKLTVDKKEIQYEWTTQNTGEAITWEPSDTWPIAPPRGNFIVNLKYDEHFGQNDRNPNLLAAAMCLLLRSLLYHKATDDKYNIALVAACCIMPFSCVPTNLGPRRPTFEDIKPYLTEQELQQKFADGAFDKDSARSVWERKIDEWDLKHVFGGDKRYLIVYKNNNINDILSCIKYGLRQQLPAFSLPYCPDKQDELLGNAQFNKDRFRSIWARWRDATLVFASAADQRKSKTMYAYKVLYDREAPIDHRYTLKSLGPIADKNDIRKAGIDIESGITLYTSQYCSTLFRLGKEAVKAKNETIIYKIVMNFLKSINFDREGRPSIEFWTPGV